MASKGFSVSEFVELGRSTVEQCLSLINPRLAPAARLFLREHFDAQEERSRSESYSWERCTYFKCGLPLRTANEVCRQRCVEHGPVG